MIMVVFVDILLWQILSCVIKSTC